MSDDQIINANESDCVALTVSYTECSVASNLEL